MPFRDINIPNAWEKYGDPFKIRRINSITGIKYLNNEAKTGISDFPDGYPFDQKRNYQFLTKIESDSSPIQSFSIDMDPENSSFNTGIISTTKIVSATAATFYTYAIPNSSGSHKVLNRYSADSSFKGIYVAKMNDIDFIINGYREFTYDSIPFNDITQPSGWVYVGNNSLTPPDTGASYSFGYEWMSNVGAISPSYSTFGISGAVSTNYIAKLIDYDKFNLKFDYLTNDEDYGIDIYLARSNRLNTKSQWTKIASVTQSTTQSFYMTGIDGVNNGLRNYLIITASQSTSTQFFCSLTDIFIYGGYNPLNNRQFLTATNSSFDSTTDIIVDIPYSSHTFDISNNGLTVSLNSKIGNGTFKSGIWENGVWNNGWRDDTLANDFENVEYSILTNSDVSWKIKIVGPPDSIQDVVNDLVVNKFKAGDKVTIGNIVAIDINDNRKLLKGQYTVEEVGLEQSISGPKQGFIVVNLDTTFPYRRIEKDSPNHKIKITKNIWLSGAFFNGYFSGVWNNGLFKGYPLITEMFDTHWIDGFFNGGHFESNYPEFIFTVISPRSSCSVGYTNLTLEEGHNIKVGDYIFIEFNNISEFIDAGGVNNYDGLVKVMAVSGNEITINRLFSSERGLRDNDGLGNIKRYTSTGLIQNFKFYDNNRSKVKSSESTISSTVFSYNSWIDVNYDNSRSVTLGRDFRAYEPLTGKSINRNNLFGYPTYDILSSASRFRDSNSIDVKLYKLGTKYKVFTDFIGEFSEFNEPFNPDIDFTNFFLGGWTYSYVTPSNIRFNRTESIVSVNDLNAQNYIDSGVTGDELFVTANNSGAIVNNSLLDLAKGRYSVAEFDVITHSVASYEYTFENLDVFSSTSLSLNSSFSTPTNLNSESNSLAKGIIALTDTLSVSNGYDFMNGFSYSSTESSSTIAKLSDGSIIVGGYQTYYNDYLLVSKYITKILPDRTVDTSFDINFGNALTGIPIRIIVDNSDNIYIASPGTSKLIKTDQNGNIDTSFNIKISGSNLNDIALDSSNNLVMVGSFATFSYGPSNIVVTKNRVARILSNGLNDATFNVGLGFPPVSGSTNTPITVTIDPSDNIYIGGNIIRYNSASNNINGIVKLSNLGAKDGTFLTATTDGFSPNGNPLNPTIKKILYDSGNLFIGGNFTSFRRSSLFLSINRLIKIDSTAGVPDTTFNIISGFNKCVSSIDLVGVDKLVVTCVSNGASYRNTTIPNGIVILDKANANLLSSSSDEFIYTSAQSTQSPVIQELIVINNDIIGVGQMDGYAGGLKEITSTYNVAQSLGDGGSLNSIEVTVNITQTDVSKLIINLKSPNGDIINLKSTNGSGSSMLNTTFSTEDIYPVLSLSAAPYSGTFKMDKILNLGDSIKSNVTNISDIDILGEWILYIKDDNTLSLTTLNNWSIKFNYDLFDTNFINNEPLAKFPLINFSNLNYEISTQRSGTETVQVYKRMNYLPISNNINHLLTTNTFRLDSIERATPEQWGGFGNNLQTKKFEYFYNKTDMMLNINGNGFLGASTSTIVMDNIKFYEVDMIPFFKYFNDVNIYKGVQIPITGLAPEIDYLDSDFIFVDNVSVGLDTIDTTDTGADIVCNQDTVDINDFTITLPSTMIIPGNPSGTQPLTINALLSNIINSSIVLENYVITWTLNGNVQSNTSGNSGNTPSVGLTLANLTTYILEVTVVYSGISHSTSMSIDVGNVEITTTTTTIPVSTTTTIPPTTQPISNANLKWTIVIYSDYGTNIGTIVSSAGVYKNSQSTSNTLYSHSNLSKTNVPNNPYTVTGNQNVNVGDDILFTSQVNARYNYLPSIEVNITKINNITNLHTLMYSEFASEVDDISTSLNNIGDGVTVQSGHRYEISITLTNTYTNLCPDPNTPILMGDMTEKRMGDIKVGEYVHTYNEVSKSWGNYIVTHHHISKSDKVIIYFEDDTFIIVSPSHRFYVDSLWKNTKSISKGDIIKGYLVDKIINSISDYEYGDVVKMTVDVANTYISNGILSHNNKPYDP